MCSAVRCSLFACLAVWRLSRHDASDSPDANSASPIYCSNFRLIADKISQRAESTKARASERANCCVAVGRLARLAALCKLGSPHAHIIGIVSVWLFISSPSLRLLPDIVRRDRTAPSYANQRNRSDSIGAQRFAFNGRISAICMLNTAAAR